MCAAIAGVGVATVSLQSGRLRALLSLALPVLGGKREGRRATGDSKSARTQCPARPRRQRRPLDSDFGYDDDPRPSHRRSDRRGPHGKRDAQSGAESAEGLETHRAPSALDPRDRGVGRANERAEILLGEPLCSAREDDGRGDNPIGRETIVLLTCPIARGFARGTASIRATKSFQRTRAVALASSGVSPVPPGAQPTLSHACSAGGVVVGQLRDPPSSLSEGSEP